MQCTVSILHYFKPYNIQVEKLIIIHLSKKVKKTSQTLIVKNKNKEKFRSLKSRHSLALYTLVLFAPHHSKKSYMNSLHIALKTKIILIFVPIYILCWQKVQRKNKLCHNIHITKKKPIFKKKEIIDNAMHLFVLKDITPL